MNKIVLLIGNDSDWFYPNSPLIFNNQHDMVDYFKNKTLFPAINFVMFSEGGTLDITELNGKAFSFSTFWAKCPQ